MSQTYFVKNHYPFPLNKTKKRNKDLTSEVIPTIWHSKEVQAPKSLSKQPFSFASFRPDLYHCVLRIVLGILRNIFQG